MPWSAVRAYGATSKHGRGRERLRRAAGGPEQHDVVAAREARPQPLARAADEPEPGVRDTRVDLVPELEQVVDVVERVVGVAVAARQQMRRHPAEHHLARLLAAPPPPLRSSGVAAARFTPCGITIHGFVDAERLVAACGVLGGDDVAAQRRGAAAARSRAARRSGRRRPSRPRPATCGSWSKSSVSRFAVARAARPRTAR